MLFHKEVLFTLIPTAECLRKFLHPLKYSCAVLPLIGAINPYLSLLCRMDIIMSEYNYPESFLPPFSSGDASSSNNPPSDIDPALYIQTNGPTENSMPGSQAEVISIAGSGKYRLAPEDVGKKGRSGWVWAHGLRLESLSNHTIWWLCQRCKFHPMVLL
jgi:hypothetical protein